MSDVAIDRIADLLDRFPQARDRLDLLVEVGSTAHNISAGSDDLDLTAVWTERYDDLMTLDPPWSTKMLRTATEGERSQPDDVDLNVYTMRKFAWLCAKGNPSILNTLFVPEDKVLLERARITGLTLDTVGFPRERLAALSHTRSAGRAYLGYLDSQMTRWIDGKIYQRVNRPDVVAAHGYDCYLDDTEFLTRRGWARYDDVQDGEPIATINQSTGQVEFQVPTERIAKPYSGAIHYGNNYGTNWAVTPNHRMWVSKVERGPSGILGSDYRPEAATWGFRRADDITTRQWHMRVAGEPRDQEFPVSDAYLALLGAYLSEGSVGKRRKNGDASVIRFEQKDGGRLHAVMDIVATEFRLRSYRYPDKRPVTTWTLSDREVVPALVKECRGVKSHKLRLPEWALDLSARQADLLLDAMLAGDGTRHRSGGWVLYTSSPGLAGDVQAMAVLSGRRAAMWGPYRYDDFHRDFFQVRIHDRDVSAIMPFKPTRTLRIKPVADARIVCFTVPNETLVTRRDGKIAMHGNTKYAAHAIRLGIQGREFLETGKVTIPMDEADALPLRAIRAGEWTEKAALAWCHRVKLELIDAYDRSTLPETVDPDLVRLFLAKWHRERSE